MFNNPHPFVGILSSLQFIRDSAQDIAKVGIGGMQEGEAITTIPKISVERNYSQALLRRN